MSLVTTRSPSFLERFQICKTVYNYYSNFAIISEYSHEIDSANLSHALRNVILANPVLGYNFFRVEDGDQVHDGKNFRLSPLNEVLFSDVVSEEKFEVDSEFLEYVNTIHFELDTQKPLFKCIVNGKYIALVFNHAYVDGNSGTSFHKDLLHELNKLDEKETLDVLVTKSELNGIPKSVDELTTLFHPPLLYTLGALLKRFLVPTWLTNLWYKLSYPNLSKYPLFRHKTIQPNTAVKYRIINIPTSECKSIISYARQNETTFTPYFTGLAFVSFQNKIAPFLSDKPKSMDATIVIDGRRYYPELSNELKYQGCVTASDIIVEPVTNLGETVRYITQSLSKDIKSRERFHYVGLLKYLNIFELYTSKIGTFGRPVFEVSNLGRVNEQGEKLDIDQLWFTQDNGFSSMITFSVISTAKKGMNIVIGSSEELEDIRNPETNEKLMDEFTTDLKSSLTNYTKTPL
ncbi:uncharacterized protein SPAPADRAFT_59178 [Spathaspora passalidarum NRRL Y-27907]|uniref:Alcohol acetyltransferase n=1 Tax=Spathaspora passalidarum (strain NRRL Y-27907 / 11-Y1) TaxID=619300 RepID=G3AJ60_SPAPN|nr:uncharacterized protein SPAPADRAFT_59178 [Spathaspora passalidarum NRRL Y-27907]EGW33817.1 hypothetical protein SPAPADRAFT_59178 [Spathaspora passalidarum NRRL Y-27907]